MNRFYKGRHRKFQDDWERAKEPVLDGITFYAKYLGMCLVDRPNDEVHTSEAIKKILHNAKYSNKLIIKKVSLKVTPKAIIQTNLERVEDVQELAIHRISFCAADKSTDNKVFAYIANNAVNEALECHAYLCLKRKIAEALTLTVAQAFSIAFDLWQQDKDEGLDEDDPTSARQISAPQAIPGSHSTPSMNGRGDACWSDTLAAALPPSLNPPPANHKRVLTVHPETCPISASAPSRVPAIPPRHQNGKPYLSPGKNWQQNDSGIGSSVDSKEMFEPMVKLVEDWHIGDDTDLDDSFSKLAESRSNPQLLDINLRRTQFDADIIVHFQGGQDERNQLLQSKSTDSFLSDL